MVLWSENDDLGSREVSQRPNVRALRPSDIGVAFQPIVDLSTGKTFAYEALVRCKVDAFRAPLALFAEAEREHFCGRLGRMIRDVSFGSDVPAALFINLHPAELSERWLVRPDDPIGFHEGDVYLEITESAAFDQPELTRRVLKDVCARVDARLVVDDFGAGYSDVFRVLELEPDVVKLDRALISNADTEPRKRDRLNYLVDLCTELGALVVVEGIETAGELRAVREAGAPLAQGYLLAKPGFPPPPVRWDPDWTRGVTRPTLRPPPRR
jgi:EAL domain-containing protein (putative c-di-GMP-specific phosphodiesterase class I)